MAYVKEEALQKRIPLAQGAELSIDGRGGEKFLIREWEQAKAETVTPNCRQKCSGCGVLKYKGGVCCESKN